MALFGPSKQEIWRQLSNDIGGEYREGGWLRGDGVRAAHAQWIVTLDTFTVVAGKVPVTFTRMRAPFVNPSGFRFSISRSSVFTPIGTWLGLQDIEIGFEPFDHDFVIKASDPALVRELFADPGVRTLVAAQRSLHLSVKDDEGWFGAHFPDGVDELYFAVAGVITDRDRLKQLFELFSEVLDRLCRIGSADPSAPGVAL